MNDNRITSYVKPYNGVPTIFVRGKPIFAAAYISYLDDRARYQDFSRAGYSIFSFPSYFGGRGINVDSGIGPFRKGIFDSKGKPDFSIFDHDVNLILQANPDALIFPRVCLGMPEWWDEEYPDELNISYEGKPFRESMSSQQWREDAGEMLSMLIDHIEASSYANSIIGYQVAAGGTEEWVHFRNHKGGLGKAAQKGFSRFIFNKYGGDVNKLRSAYRCDISFGEVKIPDDYYMYNKEDNVFFTNELKALLDFLEYTNWIVADDIVYFCGIVKRKTNRRLIAGAFYGYTMLLTDARNGHHSLKTLLDSSDVDFICSPNSYQTGRAGGVDWPCMSVLDSVKLNGKLFMNECDTRTHLTRPLKEARPSIAPAGYYEDGVWKGPDTEGVSKWFIRKCFARTLITGVGLWWFDMWGGWFASDELMRELEGYIQIQNDDLTLKNRGSVSQIAVITDESSLKFLNVDTGITASWLTNYPAKLGSCGTVYDIFDLHNADRIQISQYKLVIFLGVCENSHKLLSLVSACREAGVNLCFTYLPGFIKNDESNIALVSSLIDMELRALEQTDDGPIIHVKDGWEIAGARSFLPIIGVFDSEVDVIGRYRNSGICSFARKWYGKSKTYYCALPEMTIDAIRYICADVGVHMYSDAGDVVYANHNYICVHAATRGVKQISLPVKAHVRRMLDGCGQEYEGTSFDVAMEQYETALFRITPIDYE